MSYCLVKYYTNERDNYFYDYYYYFHDYQTSTNIKRVMCIQGYFSDIITIKRLYFMIKKKIISIDAEGREQ